MFKESKASNDLGQVVVALKGAAESTRLRLLVLLSHGEFTVGELCRILGQSQPRISRHLRVLSEAGFLDRFREQQCVYYRAPVQGRALDWSRLLLSMLDPQTPALRRDREHASRVVRERTTTGAGAAGTDVESGREVLEGVLLEELGPAGVGELLDIGTGTGLMLEILGPRARHAIGIDLSASALRLARTRVHGAGLSHCEFRRGDMYGLPFEDGVFDTVTMDRVLAPAVQPRAAIAEAVRMLRAGGRLLIVEDFEAIEARAPDNAIAELRRWLAGAGLDTGRLRPCDLPGGHFLMALATLAPRTDGAIDAGARSNAAARSFNPANLS
ncbi:MAG TPA: metalloregulator ArsR/SmtB family transcription factor [Steroidobacteraceae bacterium]|nr:metalloregulator ArsR/SmtB family transcription factor [Steroidobacteraceae bacterium]